MKLISKIKIYRFRSIKEIEIENLSNFNILTGLNNSGKSNFLRALNAFFTGYTDIDKYLDVDNDYCRFDKSRKKRFIKISVSFNLPENFKFRSGLGNVKEYLGREFTISKEWERLAYYPTYYLNDSRLSEPNKIYKIDKFLSMISFRYIPNRVVPLKLIEEEHKALRNALVRRFGIKKENKDIFNEIKDTSSKLIQKMSKDFKKSSPYAIDVKLKTPESWAEMVFALGYKILEKEIEFDDDLQGSGIQSLLMFNTLALIDRDYFQQFGWRQAAIWAIEEPESSLHTSLEAKIAVYLSEISNEPNNRLQIFSTTHSDLFIQYADSAIIVEKDQDGISTFKLNNDKKLLLQESARSGISRWVDPILMHPLEPLIIVEGKYDYDFLNQAFKILYPNINVNIKYLQILENDKSGGIDNIINYIKSKKHIIKSRYSRAPVIVLIDWDAKNKKNEIERYFSKDDPIKVIVWEENLSNPNLDRSFRGIERYFSDRIIKEAEQNGAPIAWTRKRIAKVSAEDRGMVKQKCNEVILKGINYEDVIYCKSIIKNIIDNI